MSTFRVNACVAVSDMAFYEGKLGLSGAEDDDGSCLSPCGGGTLLHVYPSPEHAGKTSATVATRRLNDVERMVDQLRTRGVRFERHEDAALGADEKGIHALGDGKVAWFRDADGNTLAVEQSLR